MSLKKFRVGKSDGTSVIIEAKNMEDAITQARSQFGQLPNDINNKITISIISDANSLIRDLGELIVNLKKGCRSLEWEEVYASAHSIMQRLNETSEDIKKLAGSMVKVDKDEEKL